MFKHIRSWQLIIALLAVLFTCSVPASAKDPVLILTKTPAYYFEGTLSSISEQEVTIVNYKDYKVIHVLLPKNMVITPTFMPGDQVIAKVTKYEGNRTMWLLKAMEKIK